VTRCKGCGREFRKGKLVFLILPSGGLKGARVCQPCADGGATLVAAKHAPIVHARSAAPEKRVLFASVVKQLQGMAKALAQTKQPSTGSLEDDQEIETFILGKQEGLEAAIEVIKKEVTG
jgi:hypothetical protein